MRTLALLFGSIREGIIRNPVDRFASPTAKRARLSCRLDAASSTACRSSSGFRIREAPGPKRSGRRTIPALLLPFRLSVSLTGETFSACMPFSPSNHSTVLDHVQEPAFLRAVPTRRQPGPTGGASLSVTTFGRDRTALKRRRVTTARSGWLYSGKSESRSAAQFS